MARQDIHIAAGDLRADVFQDLSKLTSLGLILRDRHMVINLQRLI